MILRKTMVVDFESVGADPNTCEPVQLSAIVIDPYKLEVIKDSEFDITIRPDDIDKEDYMELNQDSINWHAKTRNKSPQQIIDMWKTGVDTKTAITSFIQYINKWNPKKNSSYTACQWGGANFSFDQTIFKRYCDKYGISYKNLFWWRDSICCLHWSWSLLQWKDDCPRDFKMDTLREYYKMPIGDSHNSLQDVYDEAKIIIRYMAFFKKISDKTAFAGCFKEQKDDN